MSVEVEKETQVLPICLLTNSQEQVVARVEMRDTLVAPVEKGLEVGKVSYYLIEADGTETYLTEETICTSDSVKKIDLMYFWDYICSKFLLL
jgi:hypothetical protein